MSPSRPHRTLALAVLAILAAIGWQALEPLLRPAVSGRAVAIDGDSLRLDGRELRLEGIDAPELAQGCEADSRPVACGREARAALAALLAGGEIACRLGREDRYGRPLARCTRDGRDIAAAMVERGLALAYGDYETQELAARQARRGLWAGSFERPEDWRRRHPRGP